MHALRNSSGGAVEGVQDAGDGAAEDVLFVGHAEFFHDADGGAVPVAGNGHDVSEADAVEGVAECDASGFSGNSLPPVLAGEPPADFDVAGIRERCIPFGAGW